jgi:hypothetical protein
MVADVTGPDVDDRTLWRAASSGDAQAFTDPP